ncbi:MAG TPA: alpha/beta fold hydrolase [Phycisphaerae bacterium]|nr:alpha/beta fold hydrolase [Phycisphaerae bacterium]HUT56774.1 alpha/beta fold hydrolase [Phycisphaerae bacterium]
MKRIAVLVCIMFLAGPPSAAAEDESNVRDVTFVAAIDKTKQNYVLVLPEAFKAGQPHHLLIALHGHGSDRWQSVKLGRSEWKATRDVAARHRMILVAPDYRARTSWMGPKAEADVAQIIADLKRQYRVGKVFICGASMGGASSLTFAARRPELVDGVVSMNGLANHFEYENFQAAIRKSFGGTKAQVPLEYKNRSAEYWPERFTMPVGLAVGGKDKAVPPQSVMRLAGVLKQMNRPVLLIHREDGGHSTNYEDAKAILEFVIASALKPATRPAAQPGARSGTGARPASSAVVAEAGLARWRGASRRVDLAVSDGLAFRHVEGRQEGQVRRRSGAGSRRPARGRRGG